MRKADPDWARKVDARRDPREYQAFAAKVADALAGQVKPRLRSLEPLNGLVQWITVFLAWFIAILCARRFRWLKTPAGRDTTKGADAAYREAVEVKVYGSLSYLLAAFSRRAS